MSRGPSAIMTKASKETKGQAKLKELEAVLKAADKELAKAQKVWAKADVAYQKQLAKVAPAVEVAPVVVTVPAPTQA